MPRGFVYRVAQGGDVEVLRGVAPQGVRVANGCAFSECGSSMYFVDSPVSELRFERFRTALLPKVAFSKTECWATDSHDPEAGVRR